MNQLVAHFDDARHIGPALQAQQIVWSFYPGVLDACWSRHSLACPK